MFVNIDDSDKTKYIYRFVSLDRLYEIITSGKIAFVKPKLWDDPYENFLFKQELKLENGIRVNTIGLTEGIFGQCWTLNKETDFSWRVYTKGLRGVRIKVDYRKYHEILLAQLQDPQEEIHFGKVKYYSWKDIKAHYENKEQFRKGLVFDVVGRQDLFIKRSAFKHEAEFRILYSHPRLANEESEILFLNFMPSELIEDVQLDPRYTDAEYETIVEIIQRIGYKGKVHKSQLYSAPKLNPKL